MSKIESLKKCTTNIDFLNLIFPGEGEKDKYLEVIFGLKDDEKYSIAHIPKRDGTSREILIPCEKMKIIQLHVSKLLNQCYNELYEDTKLSANGYINGRSIITNAKSHRKKYAVINVDLDNFFPSISFGRIRNFFMKNSNFQLNKRVATLIAKICCYKNYLPQGSPCSPVISNFICRILDARLNKMSKMFNCNYTRYADDLSFSTNTKNISTKLVRKVNENYIAGTELKKIIEKSGFKINERKTRLFYFNQRQEVTGLVVNKKVNVSRKYFDQTKSMAHSYYLKNMFTIDGKKGTINQLLGRLNFINQIEEFNNKQYFKKNEIFSPKYVLSSPKSNHSVEDQKKYVQTYVPSNSRISSAHSNYEINVGYEFLSSREREFSKLLYYETFINNDKPLIVTEGKTDELYLKAALKNLVSLYPQLIKVENNKFVFNVNFLRLTKQKRYLLNLEPNGFGIFNIIAPKYIFPNYAIGLNNNNPVIILLDNENGRDKPLQNINEHWRTTHLDNNDYSNIDVEFTKVDKHSTSNKDDDKTRQIFINTKSSEKIKKFNENKKKLLRLTGTNKFFLVLIPKKDGVSEADIESLFTEETIRKYNFSRKGIGSKRKFAEKILKNYKSENFDGFKPLFENFCKIIDQSKNSNQD